MVREYKFSFQFKKDQDNVVFNTQNLTVLQITQKEIVWKRHNLFSLYFAPTLTSAQSFPKGKNLAGSFNSNFRANII